MRFFGDHYLNRNYSFKARNSSNLEVIGDSSDVISRAIA
jgi:hypothetical protein